MTVLSIPACQCLLHLSQPLSGYLSLSVTVSSISAYQWLPHLSQSISGCIGYIFAYQWLPSITVYLSLSPATLYTLRDGRMLLCHLSQPTSGYHSLSMAVSSILATQWLSKPISDRLIYVSLSVAA